MVKIRLRRVGAKKQPSYRVVVADSRSPRGGRFIETIGFYNPRTEPLTVEIKEDRALYWLSQGAQPTEAVAGLLNRLGTMDRLTRLKSGEAMDTLLSEAAAAREQLAEEASTTPEAQVETQRAAEVAEAEVAGVEQEAEEVAVADLEVNAEGTEDVANAEETIEPAEEEA
jgi:small subunit ribosomal protein S16